MVGMWTSFCFDCGQVLQRCLVSKFMSSIKCFGLLPQVHAQGTSFFWLSQVLDTSVRKREAQGSPCPQSNALTFHHTWTHEVQAFLPPNSFLWQRRRHTFSCLFLNENHELSRSHSHQIDRVIRACARVIYSRAGFGQRLLAWLSSEPTCTNSFCQIGQGYLRRDLCEGILLHLR